jgi:hypothetical protein
VQPGARHDQTRIACIAHHEIQESRHQEAGGRKEAGGGRHRGRDRQSEFGDAGEDMFHRWSAKSPQYVEHECSAKWVQCASLAEYYSVGTIFYFAHQANPGWRAVREARLLARTMKLLRTSLRARK